MNKDEPTNLTKEARAYLNKREQTRGYALDMHRIMVVSDDLAKSIGDEAGGNEADGETGDALAGFTNAGPRVVRGWDEPITVWTI